MPNSKTQKAPVRGARDTDNPGDGDGGSPALAVPTALTRKILVKFPSSRGQTVPEPEGGWGRGAEARRELGFTVALLIEKAKLH